MAWERGSGRLGALLLLLVLFGQAPAAAMQASGAQVEADANATLDAQLTAFAGWLNSVNAIHLRFQGQIMGLGPAVQQINGSGAAEAEKSRRIRAVLEQALTGADAARAEIEALEVPDFPALDLPAELRPAALKRQMLQINRDQRGLVGGVLRALTVASSDRAAFRIAMRDLPRSIAAVYDSQILFARATMESAPRDSSERAIHGIELAWLRGMSRIARAYSAFDPAVDRGLPADLAALAGEVETQVRDGETRLEAELAEMEDELAGGNVESSRAAILGRSIAAAQIGRGFFPPSRRLAAHFRELSQSLRGQILREAVLARAIGPMRQFRTDMDAAAMRQNQALAAAP